MTAEALAAGVFALASAAVVAFQLGLALGAPWGAYAMGGAVPGRLPPRLRIAVLVQALIVAGLALVVLSDAELVPVSLPGDVPWLVWLAVGFSALSVVFNAITRSRVERRLWLPVAVAMLVSSLVVAIV
jgi:hypothetical protein